MNEVKILVQCTNPDCPYCKGTGLIPIASPTDKRNLSATCYGDAMGPIIENKPSQPSNANPVEGDSLKQVERLCETVQHLFDMKKKTKAEKQTAKAMEKAWNNVAFALWDMRKLLATERALKQIPATVAAREQPPIQVS